MKAFYGLLFLIISVFSINAQVANDDIVNIPDDVFKKLLFEKGVDINNDFEIQKSEAELIKKLVINSKGISVNDWIGSDYVPETSISSLEGLEAFVNLEILECRGRSITTLDVISLIKLRKLDCSRNQLKTLNVSNLINLTELNCYTNQLENLDVSMLTNLHRLDCGGNQLKTLDVSNLINLTELNCYTNQLGNLNVSMLTNLQRLNCGDNQLKTLDVSSLVKLEYLKCSVNQLENLDVSSLLNLRYLHCSGNQLNFLNTTKILKLWDLYCAGNQLKTLDISHLKYLSALNCNDNQLTTLNLKSMHSILEDVANLHFKNNPDLKFLCISENKIEDLRYLANSYGYPNIIINSYCSFTPGGGFYTVKGKSILDIDNNSCDANDPVFSNMKFNITNGDIDGTIVSNTFGDYNISIQRGSHTITPVFENSNYFTVTPSSIAVSFPTDVSPLIQNFCITPAPNQIQNDVEVTIIPIELARPGFDARYKIIYKNKGNTTLSGAVALSFDDNVMNYLNSTPVLNNQNTGELIWNYSNLLPFERKVIEVKMKLNTPIDTTYPLNGDDVLTYKATINPTTGDETESDNVFTLNQTVVNSFDPNDKTCLEGSVITPDLVGKYVHYLIRCENTGTASAVNVVIKDVIDITKFDLSTLVITDSSHSMVTRINANVVEFIFENINLPFDDANNDGYVAFKIKTLATLKEGDTFKNNAEIFFDYNKAIVTNVALTRVEKPLGVDDFETSTNLKMYPNPVNNTLFIESKEGIQSIALYNISGSMIQQVSYIGIKNKIEISTENLSQGSYFVKIIRDSSVVYKNLIKS